MIPYIGYKNYIMFKKTKPLHGGGVRVMGQDGPSPLGNKTGLSKVKVLEPSTGKITVMNMTVSREAREAHVAALREERLALRPKKGVNPAVQKYGFKK